MERNLEQFLKQTPLRTQNMWRYTDKGCIIEIKKSITNTIARNEQFSDILEERVRIRKRKVQLNYVSTIIWESFCRERKNRDIVKILEEIFPLIDESKIINELYNTVNKMVELEIVKDDWELW